MLCPCLCADQPSACVDGIVFGDYVAGPLSPHFTKDMFSNMSDQGALFLACKKQSSSDLTSIFIYPPTQDLLGPLFEMASSRTVKQLDDAIALMYPMHSAPRPSDPFEDFHYAMAGAHGMIMGGLKHIYVVRRNDHRNFILAHRLTTAWFHTFRRYQPSNLVTTMTSFSTLSIGYL